MVQRPMRAIYRDPYDSNIQAVSSHYLLQDLLVLSFPFHLQIGDGDIMILLF